MSIIHGCNLEAMREMDDESVDLIYADPPFFTKRDFGQFTDKWSGMGSYLEWLVDRVKEMRRVLKPTGSLYLHCDWHASHYIKVELDKIFGYKNFQNEIVWSYRKMSTQTKSFQKNHDTLLLYSKSDSRVFNRQYEEYTESSKAKHRWCMISGYNLQRNRRMVTVFDWDKYNKAIADGKIDPSEIIYVKEFEGKGANMRSVWDIKIIAPTAKERVGYPTQKPEALLERVIKASSNEGDLVLDPFCGSGTTLAVAKKLGRRWIGIDVSEEAISVCKERLKRL